MPFKRGDVALALFPNSSLRTAKFRPVLVVQRDRLGSGIAQTIVAMISSNLSRAGHPSRVAISVATINGVQSGLMTDSVIMTDNLATLRDTEFGRVLGAWDDMAAVDNALRHILGL